MRENLKKYIDQGLPQFSEAAFVVPVEESETSWDEYMSGRAERKFAAVLLLFIKLEETGEVKLLLTERSKGVSTHKGQISFPGGHREGGDDTPEDTALRETEEEVGIRRNEITVLGRLPDVRSIDGKAVVPVVGWWSGSERAIVADEREINAVILAELEDVVETKDRPFEFTLFGVKRKSHLFVCEGHNVWGLTAKVIKSAGLSLP